MADYWAERMVATRAGFVVGHSPTTAGGRALLLLFYCRPAAPGKCDDRDAQAAFGNANNTSPAIAARAANASAVVAAVASVLAAAFAHGAIGAAADDHDYYPPWVPLPTLFYFHSPLLPADYACQLLYVLSKIRINHMREFPIP